MPLPSQQELVEWLSDKEQRIHLGEVQTVGEKKKYRYFLLLPSIAPRHVLIDRK